MRGNMAIRIFIAAAIIGFTYLGMYLVHAGIQVTDSELPPWKVQDLPMQLGDWKGENAKLDEKIFKATGAHSLVNRIYTDEAGNVMSLHFAVFTDPNEGIWHNPVSCYVSAGWVRQENEKVFLPGTSDDKSKVSLSIWTKGGETAVIAYWFQLGEHRLYSRGDLGTVRWQMRGQKTWPAMLKILIHTPDGNNTEEAKAQLLDFAKLVYQWINQPAHQTKNQSTDAEHAAAQ
jgi:EpsI family protein